MNSHYHIMKWMGWGWSQLMECPESMYHHIADIIRKESEAYNKSQGRIEE